jgi:carbonic anhydrase
MAKSPTQLSLEQLRNDGWLAEVVEKWIPGANIRKDLWGWTDIVALRDSETLAVQTTSYSNISARVNKITESDTISQVRKAGWSIQVHGWRKVNNRWVVKVVDVS